LSRPRLDWSMNNFPTLEKQLLHVSLSKGLDERSRAETAGEVALTRVENLVQNDTGAWSTRPGLVRLGGSYDEELPYTSVSKLLKLHDGLGIVAGFAPVEGPPANSFLHYLEESDNFRATESVVPEFSVKGRFVASSGASAEGDSGHRVICAASSTRYDVVVFEGGQTDVTGSNSSIMVINERESECEVARYNLTKVFSGAPTPSLDGDGNPVDTDVVVQGKCVFVDDRYLHVYMFGIDTLGGTPMGIEVFVLDTHGFIQDQQPPLASRKAIVPNGFGTVFDLVAVPGKSVAVIVDELLNRRVYALNNDLSDQKVTVPFQAVSCDVDGSGVLWVVGRTPAADPDRLKIYALDTTNLAGPALVNFTDPTQVGTDRVSVGATKGGGLTIIRMQYPEVTPGFFIPALHVYRVSNPMTVTSVGPPSTYYGWAAVSTPFRSDATDRVYIHLAKWDPHNGLTSHIVADCSDHGTVLPSSNSDQRYKVLRIAATLEVSNGQQPRGGVEPGFRPTGKTSAFRQRWYQYGAGKIAAVVPFQVASRTSAFAVFELGAMDSKQWSTETFGRSTFIAAGTPSVYDGRRVFESGFLDVPITYVEDSGSGSGPDGSYRYVATYRAVDINGNVTHSRTYGPVGVLVADKAVTVRVQPCQVTSREARGTEAYDAQVVVDLWRTVNGGTTYHLCASSQSGVSKSTPTQELVLRDDGFFRVTDSMTDDVLRARPIMYRQPGAPNGPVDRYAPPSSSTICCQHKDRLFVVDPYGERVFYSSFHVDGEGAWFNPAFSFQVHGGTGPITGLSSADGRLAIFRRDAIFVVDGDGPPENGGTGTEFTPPTRIAAEYGCINPMSLLITSEGTLYQSPRGIELLTRSFQCKWVGERVRRTTSAYPHLVGASLDQVGSRARFLLSNGEGAGVELVYDIAHDCWSTSAYTPGAMSDITSFSDRGTESTVYTDGTAVYRADPAVGTDDGEFVPCVVETSHVRAGIMARQRVYDVYVLGRREGNHAVRISLAHDYSDTYEPDREFQPDVLNEMPLEILNLNPRRQDVLSTRLLVQTEAPADTATYPVGTGKGVTIMGITFEIGLMMGGPKLPVAHKA
jgi:hypothetical protein